MRTGKSLFEINAALVVYCTWRIPAGGWCGRCGTGPEETAWFIQEFHLSKPRTPRVVGNAFTLHIMLILVSAAG